MKHTPDIQRLLELQRLLAQFSQIDRATHRRHGDDHIHENDTEHSYNLAMTAWYLAPRFPELDDTLLIKLALVHDLVEIHAGDTNVYAPAEELATKASREAAALERLRHEWADWSDMLEALVSYETKSSPESLFIYALDKIMPIMLIYIHEGYTWKRNEITLEMLHHVKVDKVALSPEIKPYYEALYDLLLESPDIIAPR